MAKDSYYFPHDYNARNDRKIAALVKKHKAAGYGVFWITCEMMHEEDGNIEFDEITFGAIAKDANEEIDFVKSVINDCIKEFKLFKMEDDIVISGRVSRNLEKRQEISKSRSEAGKRSANVRQMSTSVEQKATKKGKERKEIKESNEIFGVLFFLDKKQVELSDGTFQDLGQRQLEMIDEGSMKPHFIKKGKIE